MGVGLSFRVDVTSCASVVGTEGETVVYCRRCSLEFVDGQAFKNGLYISRHGHWLGRRTSAPGVHLARSSIKWGRNTSVSLRCARWSQLVAKWHTSATTGDPVIGCMNVHEMGDNFKLSASQNTGSCRLRTVLNDQGGATSTCMVECEEAAYIILKPQLFIDFDHCSVTVLPTNASSITTRRWVCVLGKWVPLITLSSFIEINVDSKIKLWCSHGSWRRRTCLGWFRQHFLTRLLSRPSVRCAASRGYRSHSTCVMWSRISTHPAQIPHS